MHIHTQNDNMNSNMNSKQTTHFNKALDIELCVQKLKKLQTLVVYVYYYIFLPKILPIG